ncbi:MAG: HXXEE domain-containing protein [Pyrinomonadaceae bacterium]
MPFNATDMLWPWLFPLAYLAHIAEEYWGGDGYSAYLSRTKGVDLTAARFLFMTGIGLALMIAGIPLARMLGFPQLTMVILGTVFVVNGLSHTISGALKARYNPGLVTGLLIWIPLGLVTLVQLRGRMSAARFLTAILIGVAIQGVVSLLSLRGGRLFRA